VLRLCAFALAIGLAACASTRAPVSSSASLLDPSRTKAELISQLSMPPERCVHSRPGYEICGWILSAKSPSWRPLADAASTNYKLNVLCELPTAAGVQRQLDSCGVYPRIALPYEQARSVSERKLEATQSLASALTLFELSQLVGSAPEECWKRSATHQRCTWLVSDQTPGHALIAAVIGEERRVRLLCFVSYDGEARSPGSCRVTLEP
jgi:hypothetical protein